METEVRTGGQPTNAAPPDHRATRREWAGLWVLALSLAMIVLDGTIVGVSLPTIIADLGLSLTDAQWVGSLYSVVLAALLLTAGRLGDRLGRRRLLLVGIATFVLGSIAAALATDPALLISSRALQGVGGALILPTTLSSVNATFRGPDRAAAFGIWGAVMSGAAAVGPLLGGWLTTAADWRWIFWVNVPIGAALLVAAPLLVPETRSDEDFSRVDILGPVLSAIGFGALVFGLIEGNDLGWWVPKAPLELGPLHWGTDAPVSAVPVVLLVGLVAIGCFVLHETRRQRHGTGGVLDVSLFAIPTFSLGNVTAGLVAVGEFALVFVLPLHLVVSLGLDALGAGLVLAAMAGGAFIAGAAARHLAAAIGAARVVVLGLALEVAGALVTAFLVGAGSSPWLVALALLPYGLGLGLAAAQLTSTVLRDVPVAASGAGSATQSTVRQVGSAFGSALGGTALAIGLGDLTMQQATATRFSSASAIAVGVAAAVLALGLVFSLLVERSADAPGPARAKPSANERRRWGSPVNCHIGWGTIAHPPHPQEHACPKRSTTSSSSDPDRPATPRPSMQPARR
ncbi:DHA2 family efflux MFS transporter permease subunit [Tessaracoccus terricola]